VRRPDGDSWAGLAREGYWGSAASLSVV
jgi:hypothetical protein